MTHRWQVRKLGELLEIQNGFAFDSKRFSTNGNKPLIRIRDLKSGNATETRYSGEYDEKYIVRAGDLLIGMDGDFGCYEWHGPDGLLNQRVCRLERFSSELVPRFVYYAINKHLKDIQYSTSFTTVKHLSSRQIKEIRLPLPPRTEQERIVSILDEAFAGIETAVANTESNLANTRELAYSYSNAVFSHQRKGWKRKALGECFRLKERLI